MGADMTDAILVEWLVKPGDRVKRGDVVAVIETQKGLLEIEVFENGVVDRLLTPAGAKAPVGATLALIAGDGAAVRPSAAQASAAQASAAQASAAQPEAPAPAPPTVRPPAVTPSITAIPARPPAHIRASPLARKVAAELGVDLANVTGSGPGGAIQREDVERAARVAAEPSGPPEPGAPARVPTAAADRGRSDRERSDREKSAAAMRAAIAAAMARSKREIPHYYLAADVDLHAALTWLEAENRQRPVTDRLLPVALLLRASALALREVPELNGFWRDGRFVPGESVHLGVAISLRQGGLVAPAIHDADQKSLDELMAALRDLVARARGGRLRGSEVSDPTITVTNLGDQGVGTVFGVIYPPQVALVGFGRVERRPWAVGDLIGIRPIVTASLSADHRASDGHRGGLYLAALERLLQQPEQLR
jgi:pyruvate dehydrogenase E2 component (dihydrolipoamide acetyltransferase)